MKKSNFEISVMTSF